MVTALNFPDSEEFECLSSNFYLFREIASQGLVHALDVDDRG